MDPFALIVGQMMTQPQVGGDREKTTNGTERRTNRYGLRRVEAVPGERYHRLTVVGEGPRCEPDRNGWRERQWVVRCDCGTQKLTRMANVRYGNIKSCGCALREGKTLFNKTTAREARRKQLEAREPLVRDL